MAALQHMTLLPERDFSFDEAQARLTDLLQREGLTIEFDHCDDQLCVSHVFLTDTTGFEVEGSGKGPAHRIGAVAEAIEHFAMESEGRRAFAQVVSSHDIAAQPALAGDAIISTLRELPEASLACVAFEGSLRSPKGESLVPLCLVNPFFHDDASEATAFLRRYATNSGSAFGLSPREAALHGYNEVVERHYLSLLFRALVLDESTDDFTQAKVPVAPLLPDGVAAVILVRANFIHDVHFAMARPEDASGFALTPIGSGASRDPDHAVDRAISEMVQGICLADYDIKEGDRRAAEFLCSSPRLRRLLDPTPQLKGWLNTTRPPAPRTPFPNQEEVLLREVVRFGEAGVWQTFVPGAERFNLIRQGNLVAPQDQLRQGA